MINRPTLPQILPGFRSVAEFGSYGQSDAANGATLATAWASVVGSGQSATLYLPPGVYDLTGMPFVSNGTYSPILGTPLVGLDQPTQCVKLVGPLPPPLQYFTASQPPLAGKAVIKCLRTDGVSGSVLIGGPQANSGGLTYQNNVSLSLENLVFEVPFNPTFSAVDLRYHQGCSFRDILIYAGATQINGSATAPTSSYSYGLAVPEVNHCANVQIQNINIFGFYNGIRLGELSTGGGVQVWGCYRGINVPSTYHANYMGMMGLQWCPYGICFDGTAQSGDGYGRLGLGMLDIENANGQGPSWQNTVANIYDPANNLRGFANCCPISANTGFVSSVVKNGGTGFNVTVFGSP